MGGARSSFRPWIFAISCGAVLLGGCGRTSKNSHTSDEADPGAAGAAGAPMLEETPNCAVAIAANRSRHCAVYQDGSVWCWGTPGPDTSGPSPSDWEASSEPQKVEGLEGIRRIELGPRHSCAIAIDGGFWCWGDNDSGQIDDSGQSPLLPTRVAVTIDSPGPLKDFGLDEQQTCVVDALSHVYCRGRTLGETDAGPHRIEVAGEPDTTMPGSLPFVFDGRGVAYRTWPSNTPFPMVSYGRDNAWIGNGNPETCMLKRWGSLWCTDYSDGGDALKAKIALGEDVVQAGPGELFSCALTRDGKVWCEGFDQVGQTGNGRDQVFADGAFIPSLSNVRQISVNSASACALTEDGKVWCWGVYAQDQRTNRPVPVSNCSRHVLWPPDSAPFAGLTRSSVDRLAEAGRARGQAICATAPEPGPGDDSCAQEEDFSPNVDCISALGPNMSDYWDCLAKQLWSEAQCALSSGTACIPAPACAAERSPVETYCRRRGCAGDLEKHVSPYQLCDGNADCADGSDELNCDRNATSFDCGDGTHIAVSALCDAKPDCANGSDETYCP